MSLVCLRSALFLEIKKKALFFKHFKNLMVDLSYNCPIRSVIIRVITINRKNYNF